MPCEQSMKPGLPGRTFELRALSHRRGAQACSSSRPLSRNRSALLSARMKLGRASRKCASPMGGTNTVTWTSSPPTSRARLPRSGTVAHTSSGSSARAAGESVTARARPTRAFCSVLLMVVLLVPVRRVRAEADLDAQPHGVRVAVPEVLRSIVVVLQPHARELARQPDEERRDAVPLVAERVVVAVDDGRRPARGIELQVVAAPAH